MRCLGSSKALQALFYRVGKDAVRVRGAFWQVGLFARDPPGGKVKHSLRLCELHCSNLGSGSVCDDSKVC